MITRSESETEAAAAGLAGKLKPGDWLALYGGLGSGKTTFTRGLCRALGCLVDVSSPTFSIINFYPGKIEVAHVDLYRLEGNFHEIGLDELFNTKKIVVVEWPEKIKKYLPRKRFDVFFKIINLGQREIEIEKRHDFRD